MKNYFLMKKYLDDEDNIFDKERKGELPEDFDPTVKPIHNEKYGWGGLAVIKKV